MPDNLSISISADTTKLRAELTQVQAQIRDVGRQLRAAAEAGDTAGVTRLSQQYEMLRASAARLQAQLRATTQTFGEQQRAVGRSIRTLGEFNAGFKTLNETLGAVRKSFQAIAFNEFIQQMNDAAKAVKDLQNEAANLGTSTREIEILKLMGGRAGVEDFTGQLQHLRIELGKMAEEQQKLTGQRPGDVPVLRGAGQTADQLRAAGSQVNVLRGGVKDVTNSIVQLGDRIQEVGDDIFAKLRLDRFKELAKPIEQVIQDIATAIDRIPEADPRRAALGAEAFGKGWAQMLPLLKDFTNQYRQAQQEIERGGGETTKRTQEQAAAWTKAWASMATAVGGAKNAILLELGEGLAPGINAITTAIGQNLNTWVNEWRFIARAISAITNELLMTPAQVLQQVSGLAAAALAQLIPMAQAAFNRLLQIFDPRPLAEALAQIFDPRPLFSALVQGAEAAVQGIIAAFNALPAYFANLGASIAGFFASLGSTPDVGGVPVPGLAGGGAVRGPGSATSDSILARLSAGEFVVRAASVQRYGAALFEALNSQRIGYQLGGLVDAIHRPVHSFADGGMVAATAGTPVHLHLGGQQFVTHADNAVASALVRVAQRSQMASAGTKPSWFAGRPGR